MTGSGRVIQGRFASGAPSGAGGRPGGTIPPAQQRVMAPGAPPPVSWPGGAPQTAQRRTVAGSPRTRPPSPASAPGRPGPPHGAAAATGHAGSPLRARGGGAGFAVDPSVLRTTGPGRALPDGVRAQMEATLGADFSAVRVHVGPQAGRIGALAFTTGTDIYFAPGQYQPDSVAGRQLIGHELTHVVQQRQGRVSGQPGALTVVQDRALEAEADRNAQRVAQSAAPGRSVQAAPAGITVTNPVRVGPGRFSLKAHAAGREVGSVIVNSARGLAAEITDLTVAPDHRHRGVGAQLMAAASRAGQAQGKTTVALSAQDDGSGRLTRWYGGLGFDQVGRDPKGHARMQAPVGRVTAAQRHSAMPGGGIVQRAEEPKSSLLTRLATPQIFEGPEIDAQRTVSEQLDKIYSREDLDGAICLGGIRLPDLGKHKDGQIATVADLTEVPRPAIRSDRSNPNASHHYLIESSHEIKREIVRFTIQTMIRSGQIAYIRESELVNDEWDVWIEIHYYPKRMQVRPQLHKDTTGQTVFVNLNYLNDDEITGPEYILNPPPVKVVEAEMEHSLPRRFRDDLSRARSELPVPTTMEVSTIPPNGVVSFVDYLIHHNTPWFKHRTARRGALLDALGKGSLRQDFLTVQSNTQTVGEQTAFDASWNPAKYWWGRPTAQTLTPRQTDVRDAHRILNGLAADGDYRYEDLVRSGVPEWIAAELITGTNNDVGSVSIPLNQGKWPIVSRPQKFPIWPDRARHLKRRMSMDLSSERPTLPRIPEGSERKFFRTWVRTVKKSLRYG